MIGLSWSEENMLINVGYTPWVNVIDCPSVIFPVTKVSADIDKVDETYQPLNELDRKIWEECKTILPISRVNLIV